MMTLIAIIAAITGLIFAGTLIQTLLCCFERNKLKNNTYGQLVPVDGKHINVEVKGNGKQVIILLPGRGIVNSILEFRSLANMLAQHFTVVTVEPLGYGLSDETGEERTIENIVKELHECIKKLGYSRYFLMGHSISGVYALYYANCYGDELEGFIGIDTSVPGMEQNIPEVMQKAEDMLPYITRFKQKTGMLRLSLWLNQRKQTSNGTEKQLTDCEKKIQKWCMTCRWLNKTMMNEVKNTSYNMEKTSGMKFPDCIPVLFLLARRNTELIPDWEGLHRDIITEQVFNHIEVLDGDHYLYHGKGKEIAATVGDWVGRIRR